MFINPVFSLCIIIQWLDEIWSLATTLKHCWQSFAINVFIWEYCTLQSVCYFYITVGHHPSKGIVINSCMCCDMHMLPSVTGCSSLLYCTQLINEAWTQTHMYTHTDYSICIRLSCSQDLLKSSPSSWQFAEQTNRKWRIKQISIAC